ncbi:MAG: hypothetical protein HYZ92_03215 [Candidatus Omnitrophica bacterium]|nr:hypothetical protein [Candidatus Omnitrophota bacterium]
MQRTTLILDEALYRAVKRKAVDVGRPMRALIEEALRAYLGLRPQPPEPPTFGVYHARIRGSIRRRDIYDDHLERKYPKKPR